MKKLIVLTCLLFFCFSLDFFTARAEEKLDESEIIVTKKYDVVLKVSIAQVTKKDIANNAKLKNRFENYQKLNGADCFLNIAKEEVVLYLKAKVGDGYIAYKVDLRNHTLKPGTDDCFLAEIGKKLAEKLMKENEIILISSERILPVKILKSYSNETFKISEQYGWGASDKVYCAKLIFIKKIVKK